MMSKTNISHNNNNKFPKKKYPINNQLTDPFFISNVFIDFSESI